MGGNLSKLLKTTFRPGNSNAATTTCEICCARPSSVTLSNCAHASCRECMTTWIQQQEHSSRDDTDFATCPFCRVKISSKDVRSILGGRTFRRRIDSISNEQAGEVDDLTRQWLLENTKSCPRCHVAIEKNGGCRTVQCICGCRFCYCCGNGRCRDPRCNCGRCGLRNRWCACHRRQLKQIKRERMAAEERSLDDFISGSKWLYERKSNKETLRLLGNYYQVKKKGPANKKSREKLFRWSGICSGPVKKEWRNKG